MGSQLNSLMGIRTGVNSHYKCQYLWVLMPEEPSKGVSIS